MIIIITIFIGLGIYLIVCGSMLSSIAINFCISHIIMGSAMLLMAVALIISMAAYSKNKSSE